MKTKQLRKTAKDMREGVDKCDNYAIGCFQCLVNRLADDLESLADILED